MKSARNERVDVGRAQRIAAARLNGGYGELCPASAGALRHDVYGRRVNQNTLKLDSPDCHWYTDNYNVQQRLATENIVERSASYPILPAGRRGGADTMGAGRDLQPMNLYGEGRDGSFVRHYATANNQPESNTTGCGYGYGYTTTQPYTFSHDASNSSTYGRV